MSLNGFVSMLTLAFSWEYRSHGAAGMTVDSLSLVFFFSFCWVIKEKWQPGAYLNPRRSFLCFGRQGKGDRRVEERNKEEKCRRCKVMWLLKPFLFALGLRPERHFVHLFDRAPLELQLFTSSNGRRFSSLILADSLTRWRLNQRWWDALHPAAPLEWLRLRQVCFFCA